MGQRSIVMSVSVSTQTQALRLIIVRVIKCLYVRTHVCLCVCVYVFVCPRSHLRNYTSDLHQIFMRVTYGRGSVLLWRRNDT